MEGWATFVQVAFFLITAKAASSVKEQRDAASARIVLLEHSQALEHQIIEISEREQQRIGQDLHDGICQYLAALSCAATSLKSDLERRLLHTEAKAAGDLADHLRDAVVQIRNLARGLVPVQMDDAGLAAAVEELTASVSRLQGINCSYEAVGSPAIFENAAAIHLYRIAQEAISNATHHGHAQNVVVSLIDERDATILRIADDGAGISNTEPRGNGMGLSLMQYRARLVGGELKIEEPSAGGTIVSCGIPTSREPLQSYAA
jgi:signal transduction histidine kinase